MVARSLFLPLQWPPQHALSLSSSLTSEYETAHVALESKLVTHAIAFANFNIFFPTIFNYPIASLYSGPGSSRNCRIRLYNSVRNKDQARSTKHHSPWGFPATLSICPLNRPVWLRFQEAQNVALCSTTVNNESPCTDAGRQGGSNLLSLLIGKKLAFLFFLRIVSGLFLFTKENL